jgi:hypothetical protein
MGEDVTEDNAHRRRPPPATGRQDRHAQPASRMPDYDDIPPVEPLPGPRGAEYYARSRSQPYGLGCLIVLALLTAGTAVVLLALALMPARDTVFEPAAPPAATAPGEPAAAPATTEPGGTEPTTGPGPDDGSGPPG